jgi:hypothetical protein
VKQNQVTCEGTVDQKLLPPGQSFNHDYYRVVSQRPMEQVRRKRLERWLTHDWATNHDNATAHTAFI